MSKDQESADIINLSDWRERAAEARAISAEREARAQQRMMALSLGAKPIAPRQEDYGDMCE